MSEPTKEYQLPVVYRALAPTERRAVREQYKKEQNGKCAYCHFPLSSAPAPHVVDAEIEERLFPETFFRHPEHLHHDHTTGYTVGCVHARCNAYMWQYHGE